MTPKTLITIANVVAVALGGLAAANVVPSLTAVFAAVAGALAGWVNANRPGQPKDPK